MREAETDAHTATPPGRPTSRKASLGIFATSVVVVLATTLSPPLLRMFAPELWEALGITEVQYDLATGWGAGLCSHVGLDRWLRQQGFCAAGRVYGVSQAEVAQEVSSLAVAAGDTSLVLASEAEIRALDLIAPGFKLAYTIGLSRAFLVLAGMCVFGAAVVRFGLRSTPGKG